MIKLQVLTKKNIYQVAVIFSVLFALIGFSYNVWRMEVSEENNNVRTACFEMLLTLSSLEQLVYAAHYDKDDIEGNPRNGWIKVGLIADLSLLTSNSLEKETTSLKKIWSDHWSSMKEHRESTNKIIKAIDSTRNEIKRELSRLR